MGIRKTLVIAATAGVLALAPTANAAAEGNQPAPNLAPVKEQDMPESGDWTDFSQPWCWWVSPDTCP